MGLLIGLLSVGDRILTARFKGQPFDVSVIQVYAPTADRSEEDLESFFLSARRDSIARYLLRQRGWVA